MTQTNCLECGKLLVPKSPYAHPKYCDECQPKVRRRQKAAAAKTFRIVHAEQVRAADRLRDKDPKRREYVNWSHRSSLVAKRNDPAFQEKRRLVSYKSHDSRFYGGHSKEVFVLYGNKCVVCGTSEGRLNIHHKDGKGSSVPFEKRNNSLDNLVLLCVGCHTKIHKSGIKKGDKS